MVTNEAPAASSVAVARDHQGEHGGASQRDDDTAAGDAGPTAAADRAGDHGSDSEARGSGACRGEVEVVDVVEISRQVSGERHETAERTA